MVVASRFAEAGPKLERARQAFGNSDVFEWFRRAELDELAALVAAELAARPPAPAPAPAPAPPPAPEPGPAPGPEPGPTPAVPGADVLKDADVRTVDLEELAVGWAKYDGKLVRLNFAYRGTIAQAGPGMHSTSVGERGIEVGVEFPEAGLDWMRGIAMYSYTSRQRIVYGVVDGARQVVTLVGRTRKSLMGAGGNEYSW
jgi:hypothetical protein